MRHALLSLVVLTLGLAGSAFAQARAGGPVIGAPVAVTFGDGGSHAAGGFTVGWNFARNLGAEFDFAYLPSQQVKMRGSDPCPGCPLPADVRVMAGTANLVVSGAADARWVRPYALAGVGLGNTRSRPYAWSPSSDGVRENHLALAAGVGVEFRVWQGLGIGGEVRYLHLFGAADGLDLPRIGTRVSYRF